MPATADNIASELSELRTMVLGAQIFLGFQYEAIFMPRFKEAIASNGDLFLMGFAGLFATIAVLVGPTSHHRLAEHGEATRRQDRFANVSLLIGAFLFALTLGIDTAFALGVVLSNVILIAITTSAAALIAWFGVEFVMRKSDSRAAAPEAPVSLKDKITTLMSEGRIVLPGVQALLGFQLAAYLSDGFSKLSPSAQEAHHIGLALLIVSMILIMAPAPFHRIAEHGEATKRAETVGVWLVMSGLGFLALALAADLTVAVEAVTHDAERARWAGAIAGIAALSLWFIYPLTRRATQHGQRSDQASAQS